MRKIADFGFIIVASDIMIIFADTTYFKQHKMTFEYTVNTNFDVIERFAKQFDIPLQANGYAIPETLGNGFGRRYVIEDGVLATVQKFNLKQELILKRIGANKDFDRLAFRFYAYANSDNMYLSNAQLMTQDLDNVDVIPPHTIAYYVVLTVNRAKLAGMLELPQCKGNIEVRSFLYQENMTYEMKSILRNISEFKIEHRLDNLYIKIKIQELFYHFCKELASHNREELSAINKRDIEKILALRDAMLADLGIPPVLKEMARKAGMSETKIKFIFKKIYGNSIYNYYQAFRMNEAASLLKNDKSLAISEVAYTLGFTNLSHFSRLFKKHIGLLPKEHRK